MNIRVIFVPALLVLGVLNAARAATVNISIDPNGNGSINGSALTGTLQQDPGPGGLASVLTYAINSPTLIAGDVQLTLGGSVQDDIRFNPPGTGGNPNYLAGVLFYASGPGLAQTPPPNNFYLNNATLALVLIAPGTLGDIYTPAPGQPGFVNGSTVTYTIAAAAVPEPTSLLLVISGVSLLGVLRIARNRSCLTAVASACSSHRDA